MGYGSLFFLWPLFGVIFLDFQLAAWIFLVLRFVVILNHCMYWCCSWLWFWCGIYQVFATTRSISIASADGWRRGKFVLWITASGSFRSMGAECSVFGSRWWRSLDIRDWPVSWECLFDTGAFRRISGWRERAYRLLLCFVLWNSSRNSLPSQFSGPDSCVATLQCLALDLAKE
jgi:hypothetical protein